MDGRRRTAKEVIDLWNDYLDMEHRFLRGESLYKEEGVVAELMEGVFTGAVLVSGALLRLVRVLANRLGPCASDSFTGMLRLCRAYGLMLTDVLGVDPSDEDIWEEDSPTVVQITKRKRLWR